jgi:hypothetical protein
MAGYRFQIELSDGQIKSIEDLMQELGINTKREVLLSSLVLFQWAVARAREGGSIFAKNKDGNLMAMRMPWMSNFSQ